MSKLSIIITHPKKLSELNFLTIVQEDVNAFFSEGARKNAIDDEQIILSWYDDAPVSNGVALTATFQSLEGFDFLAELQIHLRKKEYSVSVTLGY